MPCKCCKDAREYPDARVLFDPRCLWCGARLLQRIPAFCKTNAEASQRRKAQLAVWMAQGHAESELRELAKSKTLAFEPVGRGKG